MNELEDFINPHSKYRGSFSPESMVFNRNLQEFTNKVSYIVALETNGKITPNEAYKKIKTLFKELKASKKNLLKPMDINGPMDNKE